MDFEAEYIKKMEGKIKHRKDEIKTTELKQERFMNIKSAIKALAVFALASLLLSLVAFNAHAIPTPKGISGRVYDLDGITPAGNVFFSVNDIDSGELVEGVTRSDGRYSVSLNGNNGNSIIIEVWNKYNSNSRNVTLNGVMRNVDVLLNMTLPELPPEIISEPVTEAYAGELYLYHVAAVDENNDILEYSLIAQPEGMEINKWNGTISWVPDYPQEGDNLVVVQVSDGIFNVTQNFSVNVSILPYAPEIVSEPITSAVADEWYYYSVEAFDKGGERLSYRLTEKPGGMQISDDGVIRWRPERQNLGNNLVIIEASNSYLSARQEFVINVKERPARGGRPGFALYEADDKISETDAGVTDEGSEEDLEDLISGQGNDENRRDASAIRPADMRSNVISGVFSEERDEIEFTAYDFKQRPAHLRGIDKKVYRYIEINSREKIETPIKILFHVSRKWLEQNNAKDEDVVLNHYSGSEWEELSTGFLYSDDEFSYYEAYAPSLSFFAVSLREKAGYGEISVSGPGDHFIVSGIVYDWLFLQARDAEIIIINHNRDDTTVTRTGIGGSPGAFYAIIPGNIGDRITVRAEINGRKAEKELEITGDMRDISIMLERRGLLSATGMFLGIPEGFAGSAALGIYAIAGFALLAYFYFRVLGIKNQGRANKVTDKKESQGLNFKKKHKKKDKNNGRGIKSTGKKAKKTGKIRLKKSKAIKPKQKKNKSKNH